jgi:hypothetical protein
MIRFRLSTLMLLIVIAALATALVVERHRAGRREAGLRAMINANRVKYDVNIAYPKTVARRRGRQQPTVGQADGNGRGVEIMNAGEGEWR